MKSTKRIRRDLTPVADLTPNPSPKGEGNLKGEGSFKGEGNCYDLMGRPWVEGRHGLYIKNGKKYIK